MSLKKINTDNRNAIFETIKSGIKAYQKTLNENKFEHLIFDLDCSKLQKPSWNNESPIPKSLNYIFDVLPENKPCLYYFEIIDTDTSKILEAYKAFLKVEDKKKKPRRAAALKKNPPLDSSNLYVGKVKYDIWGRMMVHLGYYHVEATAGLQLVCWAKDVKLKLKIHIYVFEKEMANFVSPLELPLARTLKPLIGKH